MKNFDVSMLSKKFYSSNILCLAMRRNLIMSTIKKHRKSRLNNYPIDFFMLAAKTINSVTKTESSSVMRLILSRSKFQKTYPEVTIHSRFTIDKFSHL